MGSVQSAIHLFNSDITSPVTAWGAVGRCYWEEDPFCLDHLRRDDAEDLLGAIVVELGDQEMLLLPPTLETEAWDLTSLDGNMEEEELENMDQSLVYSK